MRRLRTSYVDDWEDFSVTDDPRFRVLGLSIPPIRGVVIMAGCLVVLLAIFYVNALGWFTETQWLRRTISYACTAGLLVVLGLAIAALLVMARHLRRQRIQLARLDGATHDEAVAETGRFMLRTVYARLVIYAVASVVVWLLLGSRLVFQWTSPLTYFCGLMVVVVLFVAHSIFGRRLDEMLRGLVNRFR